MLNHIKEEVANSLRTLHFKMNSNRTYTLWRLKDTKRSEKKSQQQQQQLTGKTKKVNKMNEEDLQLSRVQPNRQKATTKKKEQIEELLI